jgi:hypothetical protein
MTFIPDGTYRSGNYTDSSIPQSSGASTATVNGNYLTLITVMNGVTINNNGTYRIDGNRLTLRGEVYSFTSNANGFYLDGILFSKSL